MCGIFGIVSDSKVDDRDLGSLARHAMQRGRDSSGLIVYEGGRLKAHKADYDVMTLLGSTRPQGASMVLGHSRLVTNGLGDNQPVVRGDVLVLHNGIVVNDEALWETLGLERKLQIDTEIIAAIAERHVASGGDLSDLPSRVLSVCQGVVACALVFPKLGKLLIVSNNGSLYRGKKGAVALFSSEKFPLETIGCTDIRQVREEGEILDIPSAASFEIVEKKSRQENLIPSLLKNSEQEKLLWRGIPKLRRCTKCILPETMPFIKFDQAGVCNYCAHYKLRNTPKPVEQIFDLVKPYRRANGPECIVPFSGGRDSCFGLHLIIKELKLRPIAYTYDWGMVTDLGRRNISRMCAALGVENIIVAADISQKRRNIALNLKAWLKSPHLGMVSILTAGDKHFFRHVETVKKQTGVSLNLWGVNPLEVTHFKAGFLGVPPDFEEERVYMHGIKKQLRYQSLRFKAMKDSPGYFNWSILDTLTGEYFRSFTEKSDYFHIFDYWRWDEKTIDDTLQEYDWERAPDTNTTWRIGDGTAAFYNYIYYVVAGFSEHDTFRSNQIREGQITREEALRLVEDENQPRYQNIRWYLDAIGMDFVDVIKTVNAIPKLFHTHEKSVGDLRAAELSY